MRLHGKAAAGEPLANGLVVALVDLVARPQDDHVHLLCQRPVLEIVEKMSHVRPTLFVCAGGCRHSRPHAQHVTDRDREIGAVQRVEM